MLATKFWLLRPSPSPSFHLQRFFHPRALVVASGACLSHKGSAVCLADWVPASLELSSLTSLPLPSPCSCLCSLNYSLTWPCKTRYPEIGKPPYPPHPIISRPLTALHSSTDSWNSTSSQEVDFVRQCSEKYWRCLIASPRHSVPSPFPALYLFFIGYWEPIVLCKEICLIFYFDSPKLIENLKQQ